MATTLIKPKKYGANPKRLTTKQRDFVYALMADPEFDQVAAAKSAGYGQPTSAACKLLKNKAVAAMLGKEMRLREERCRHTADDVLNFLHTGLFLDASQYFEADPDFDGWCIKDPSELPLDVRRLIENIELVTVKKPTGSKSRFVVTFIAKATLLTLAMKHHNLMGTQKVDGNVTLKIDFDALCERGEIIDVASNAIEEMGD